MNKEFIQYEEALALKELGFDGDCLGQYLNGDFRLGSGMLAYEVCSAPLYQQAFRWFKENHKLIVDWRNGFYQNEHWLDWDILEINLKHGYEPIESSEEGLKSEEAELACLKKLIEIVNQNKDE